jgi:hypothetical protein
VCPESRRGRRGGQGYGPGPGKDEFNDECVPTLLPPELTLKHVPSADVIVLLALVGRDVRRLARVRAPAPGHVFERDAFSERRRGCGRIDEKSYRNGTEMGHAPCPCALCLPVPLEVIRQRYSTRVLCGRESYTLELDCTVCFSFTHAHGGC